MKSFFNKSTLKVINNESGFVLIGTLFILTLLMIVGMGASTDTTLEIQIAGNERTHKETFYQADGGADIGIQLVEESIAVTSDFTQLVTIGTGTVLDDPVNPNSAILIVDTTLWDNEAGRNPTGIFDDTVLEGGGRDAAYFPGPVGYDITLTDPNTAPHTNIIADSVTSAASGAGLQMLAGYEGKGKGAAGGGVHILYTIYSQHIGNNQSESLIGVEWLHVVGLEVPARY